MPNEKRPRPESQEGNGNALRVEPVGGQRELIVVTRPEASVRVGPQGVAAAQGFDTSSLSNFLKSKDISMKPLFGMSEDRMRERTAALRVEAPDKDHPDLSIYYHVEAPDDELADLAAELVKQPTVVAAYVKPPGELPAGPAVRVPERLNDMQPAAADAPPVSPNFIARQTYLDQAPGGVDARYAWTIPGGSGNGVRVIDLEWGWQFTHEDLLFNSGGLLAGVNSADNNHGTAVLGEIGGDQNTIGVSGIAPNARLSAVAFSMPTAQAIRTAADQLGSGDIMLLEIHRAGPRHNFQGRQDQLGYIAIEWWPDDFDAIRYATNKGIVVVEAAGNGAENLDDPIYSVRPAGFPANWANPFNRANRDSGAILVGAGAPPPGTHGRNHGPDRSRLDFSNFGSALDAQGWGREVTTTGYGDLQGGSDRNLWYTDTFSGTSSASPIVTAALACVQGALRTSSRVPLSPARCRELLRSTGSAQQDATGRPATQRIGNRPNLRQLIPAALQTSTWVGVQFTGTLGPNQTRRWFTYNWPAHWHVIWTFVPTSPDPGKPQIRWNVMVERASDSRITYWLDVANLTNKNVTFEGRYCVLGW